MSSDIPHLSVNGEYASEKDLHKIETKAHRLLKGLPAEYHRNYGYVTDDGRFAAIFSTQIYEEDVSQGSIASVEIDRQDNNEALFAISYDYDNQPIHLYCDPAQNMQDCVVGLQRFVDDGNIPAPDIDVLRFMQSIAFCIMGAADSEALSLPPTAVNSGSSQHVADIIRTQVLKNTNGAVRTKVWGLPIDEADSTLTISTNEVLGELSEHEAIASIPALQVEYEDKANEGIVYIYSRYGDGESKLVTSDPRDEELDEALEEELAAFRDSIGATIPGNRDAKILIRALSQAALLKQLVD